MPTEIDRDDVQQMTSAGAQLLDARSREDYDAEHLPGALSVPAKELDREMAARLDPSLPVITYCWDSQ
jgi:rhodanese-related sulfurtransferase